jgi:hypothetical protein
MKDFIRAGNNITHILNVSTDASTHKKIYAIIENKTITHNMSLTLHGDPRTNLHIITQIQCILTELSQNMLS